MPGKRGKRRFKRPGQIIGFKAFDDTDADILAWWNKHLEPGKRSQVVRQVVRDHLLAQDGELLDVAHEIAELKALVQALADQQAVLMRKIERGVRIDTDSDDPPGRDAFADEYRTNVLRRQW